MSKHSFSDLPYKIYIEKFSSVTGETLLMIPGAYHSGLCYTQTPDGRKGWAPLLAEKGFDVLVTDLPGTGRSGYIPFEDMSSNFIVEAYADLIRSIEGQIILLTHSLSGPIGFKLVENLPNKISALVSVEPGLLGNVQEISSPLLENSEVVKIKFKGLDFEVKMNEMSLPSQQMADRLSKNCTKRFPADSASINQYLASLQSVHPKLLYERFNIKGSQLKIEEFNKLKNTKLLMVTGTEDQVHKDEDYKIADLLRQNGISVDHYLLGEKGIDGNGHMMMLENNNEEILNLIIEWL